MYTFVATNEQILQEKAMSKGHYVTEPLVLNEEGYNEPLLHVNGVKNVNSELIELKLVFNISKALKENGETLVHPNGGCAWAHKFIGIPKNSCLFKAAKNWYIQNRNFLVSKGSWKSLNLTQKTFERGARIGHIICDYYVVQVESINFQTTKEGWQFIPMNKLFIDEQLEPKFVYKGCGMPADKLSSEFEDYTQTLAQKYNIKLPSLTGEKNMG